VEQRRIPFAQRRQLARIGIPHERQQGGSEEQFQQKLCNETGRAGCRLIECACGEEARQLNLLSRYQIRLRSSNSIELVVPPHVLLLLHPRLEKPETPPVCSSNWREETGSFRGSDCACSSALSHTKCHTNINQQQPQVFFQNPQIPKRRVRAAGFVR
jgi:hypothetical protein